LARVNILAGEGKEAVMKGYRIVTIIMMLAVLLMFMGCAGTSGYMENATPVTGPPSDKALVYFMRPSAYGFAINFQIWDGDHFIGLSQAKSYFAYPCEPGTHLFLGIAENKVALEADVEARKKYYVGTNVRTGVWKARVLFTPVTRGSELWDKVEAYEGSLSFVAVKEEERAKWEAAKKQEALALIEYFTTGEGRTQVLKLSREDGR
jgi:hypothetical protein